MISLDGNNLNYTSDIEIGGFQFNHDGCVNGASGGEAASAGFTVSASAGVVLGFSFTGSTLPSGENLTLTELDGDVSQGCISDFVFSSGAGESLSVDWQADEEPPLSSCSDELDVCLSLDGNNLIYSTDIAIGGFQFNHNGCVNTSSGGEAASAGFTVSRSGSVVLGFSFSGTSIDVGSGPILEITVDTPDGDFSTDLSFIFHSSRGLPFFFPSSVQYFCELHGLRACEHGSGVAGAVVGGAVGASVGGGAGINPDLHLLQT